VRVSCLRVFAPVCGAQMRATAAPEATPTVKTIQNLKVFIDNLLWGETPTRSIMKPGEGFRLQRSGRKGNEPANYLNLERETGIEPATFSLGS
jgi:hypothetical protein